MLWGQSLMVATNSMIKMNEEIHYLKESIRTTEVALSISSTAGVQQIQKVISTIRTLHHASTTTTTYEAGVLGRLHNEGSESMQRLRITVGRLQSGVDGLVRRLGNFSGGNSMVEVVKRYVQCMVEDIEVKKQVIHCLDSLIKSCGVGNMDEGYLIGMWMEMAHRYKEMNSDTILNLLTCIQTTQPHQDNNTITTASSPQSSSSKEVLSPAMKMLTSKNIT